MVILVDDILTTSATLESCARVLREAGAAAVYGFAIAREV
jgi:predicted amidophosphoribosyltransferase